MGVLETHDLTRTFGGLVAVNEVSIDVPRGELRGIIGPNGAGKTTLFNCITGTFEPDSGDVRLEEQSITGLPPHEIAQRGIARSFQNPQLFPNMSVADNIYLARLSGENGAFSLDITRQWDEYSWVETDVDELLKTIGLEEIRDTPAHNLSHGDKRRLEIGLALALDSSVIMLDEPLAGLSMSEIDEMMAFLESLSGDHTLVIIEHNIDALFEISDTVTVLHNGEVLLTDTPQTVQEDQEVLEVYFKDE